MGETPTRVRTQAPRGPEPPREEMLLGRYRVLERRGTGGFGTVCTCWDTRLQRRVAIKRMPLASTAETGTTPEEALREARTACMLPHPNIVAVHDFEAQGAYAYLVMEYVDGLNLAELLARVEGGRLTPDECAHVLASLAKALSFAHENRALHLDIKPSNIMIDRQGTVKLADFGMSTLASAAGYGGARGGTVGYMPPEQIESMLVDERADVFSLAVVVWQALTGRDPFLARSDQESLALIRRGPARRLAKDCPEAGPEVEEVLLAALEPAAADRTSSVAELADELCPLLGDAAEGAASLRDLVEQAEQDDGSDSRARRAVPLAVGLPPLGAVLARALTALAVFAALRLALPLTPGADERTAAAAALVSCLASAAWTPLGAPLVVLAIAWAIASGAVAAATLAAMALVAVTALWWARVGRSERLSSLTLLLPCCLPSPVAGAALAGFAMDPGPAAASGALGCALGTVFRLGVSTSFSPDALLPGLLAAASSPETWVLLVACAACGAVSAAVALHGSVAAGVIGQALGLACLVAGAVFAARMENGGIWEALDGATVVVAVLLFVFLCIATVLRGPLYEGPEGGGR
ncbi:serine/threonine-protein kinase [Olsenella profusa]|uniref:serine/threonine-protein kinase n=1 Tax=Olsenella profusa TaxID=138595 RepID=UPI00315B3037